jgi:glucosylceramidase
MRFAAARGRRRGALVAGACALIGLVSPAPGRAAPDPYLVSVVQTDPAFGQRLARQPDVHFGHTTPPATLPRITVDEWHRYQRIAGFGAAMTDSSAWLIQRRLAALQRAQLMDELFSRRGLGLGFLRVPIGASDFTVRGMPYTYDDLPIGQRDPRLQRFSIAHDRAYILPALKAARALAPELELLATPWTPPAWMKGNDSLSNVAHRGTLLGSAWAPWAQYIVRFLQAYAAAGVPIDALTPQNEPTNPTRYPGLELSAWAESRWIDQDLLPALQRAHLRPAIYGGDAGWASTAYARTTAGSAAAGDLTGLAWHCYYGSPAVMSDLRAAEPGLGTIVDECSPGISAIPTPEVVIGSLRNWASTVALWNLALDPRGGPVQPPDSGCPGCYGLATIAESTGVLTLNEPYWQLGQASRYLQRGAVRVRSNSFVTYDYTRPGINFVSAGLDDVAAINPDGSRVLIAYDNAAQPISFAVAWHGVYFRYTIPAGAMVTFTWRRAG